jgi:hypothetical protein
LEQTYFLEEKMKNRMLWYCCIGLVAIAVVAMAVTGIPGTRVNRTPSPTASALAPAPISNTQSEAFVASNDGNIVEGAKGMELSAGAVRAGSQARTELNVVEDDGGIIGEAWAIGQVPGHGSSNPLDVRCTFTRDDSLALGHYSSTGFVVGDQIKVWENPTYAAPRGCGANPYPFKIDTIQFSLRVFTRDTFCVTVDIECPNIPGDSCSGPGYPIYSQQYCYLFSTGTIPGSYIFPAAFTTPVCVNGPFFVGIQITSFSGNDSVPSFRWNRAGAAVGDTCRQFLCDATGCTSWYNVFASPANTGSQYLIVKGNSNDACTPTVCQNCVVTCPETATPEGEPICSDGYVDTYNGGCNSVPEVYQDITCGATICGHSGTFVTDARNQRDTDWYRLVLTQQDSIAWKVVAEFPATVYILGPGGQTGCDTINVFASASGAPCDTIIARSCLDPGTYWLFVGPSSFTGVACGATYFAQLTCAPCTPCVTDFTMTAPGFVTGTTCGAGDDCTLRTGLDRVVEVVIPHDGNWTFTMCGGTTSWDSYIFVTNRCCRGTVMNNPVSDDDGCGVGGGLSAAHCIALTAGTYYVDIEPWDETLVTCGPFRLDVTECVPCILTAPVGAVLEGEPPCADGYIDTYNGGCSGGTPAFSTLQCGQSVFGQTGVFTVNDTLHRDTDWYQLTLTQRSWINWKVTGEGLMRARVYNYRYANCDSIQLLDDDTTAYPCDTANCITSVMDPGTYLLLATPYDFDPNMTCGTDYIGTVTCYPVTTPTCQTGDVAECAEVIEPAHTDNDCDGGCNMATPVFQDVTCSQTVCGILFTYNSTDTTINRDLDWYKLTLTTPQRITVSAVSGCMYNLWITGYPCEFDTTIAFKQSTLPNVPTVLMTDNVMPAGDYIVIIGCQQFYGVPVAQPYRMTFGCPCTAAEKVTNYLNVSAGHVQVNWFAAAPGTYKVYSTTDKNIAFDAGTWATEATVSTIGGLSSWEDLATPVVYKRYVVVHVCE